MPDAPAPLSEPQTARLALKAGSAAMTLKVRVTPTGLLAIGGLVGTILLSTAVLVWTATGPKRLAAAGRPRR
ncbi:MAG: hypothetical protein SWI22_12890 [Pseudomonadota bacterium]|nr:hypothetical protein [Pseudomonadota bacterium]